MLSKLFEATSPNKDVIEEITNSPKPLVPPVVSVIAAKGGAGATSVAVNLAVTFAATGLVTTLIDANFQQPDVANTIGLEPEHSLLELLGRRHSLDKQLFDNCSAAIMDLATLSILSPPIDGGAGFKANLTELCECICSVRSFSKLWIIDLPRHIDKHLVAITDLSDKILLVFEPTVQSVATCRRWLNIFNELGYDRSKIICILNRSGSKYTGVEQQLSQYFSDETIFRIPNASSAAWQSSTSGKPIVSAQPSHKYSLAMLKLARELNRSFLEG